MPEEMAILQLEWDSWDEYEERKPWGTFPAHSSPHPLPGVLRPRGHLAGAIHELRDPGRQWMMMSDTIFHMEAGLHWCAWAVSIE